MQQPPKSKPFHILLSEKERQNLADIAAHRGTTPTHLIRTAIHAMVHHTDPATPTCGDGTPCLCPYLWQRTLTPARLKTGTYNTKD